MAHKKRPFRFRIPWLSGTHILRRATELPSRHPTSPTKPNTNVSIQNPQAPLSPGKTSVTCSSSPASKTDPATSQQSSPLAIERTSKVLKPNFDESAFLASSSQGDKEKITVAVPAPVLQETEPMKSPLKIIPKSPETSSQQGKLSKHYKAVLGDEERSKVLKVPLGTQSKQAKEKEKMMHHQPIKAEKDKDTTNGQSVNRNIVSASGSHTKGSFTRMFRAHKKQNAAKETVQRKVMFATSNPSKQDIRVVSSSDQGTHNVSSIPPERLVLFNEDTAPLQHGIKDDITKFVQKLATVHPTQPMDDKQFTIITLAGDNRGATLHVGTESVKKEGLIHIHRNYKANPQESTEVIIDGEENSNTKKDSHSSTKHGDVGKTYVNSNIQSINNSLMFHGSVTERDPGVQVILPRKLEETMKSDDKLPRQTHTTEFNTSCAEKSTYQPMIRRRRLRGLFLEPRDSGPDNPDKPHHHGCKFSCDKNKKVEDIEDL